MTPIYDALLHSGKPSLPLKPITMIYEGVLYKNGAPNQQYVQSLLTGTGPICFDIETHGSVYDSDWGFKMAAIEQIIGWAQSATRRPVGTFGTFPLPDYWRSACPRESSFYKGMQSTNELMGPLATQMDYCFFPLYAHYSEPERWILHAESLISEARRISNKEVYPFLWYRMETPGNPPLSDAFWRQQLSICLSL